MVLFLQASSGIIGDRMSWWRDARFGMFVHWGLYSILAGEYQGAKIDSWPGAEWIMAHGQIPVAQYAALASGFNPTKFDAEALVDLAVAAGMKYIVFTAKHHEGFAMFRSTLGLFDLSSSGVTDGRDMLRELSDACRARGMKLGIYYSHTQDWHHAGGASLIRPWDASQHGDFADYFRTIAIPHVRDLLTRYGPVSILWWDTPTTKVTPALAREMADVVAACQPGTQLIQNNRLTPEQNTGDFGTPEQTIPSGHVDGDWETCMTMNDTWGYSAYDKNFKSATSLIRNLIQVASLGGNLLLNVGPDAQGVIHTQSVSTLQEMGDWVRRNDESIYGTMVSRLPVPSWGRVTMRHTGRLTALLYLHVFEWPATGLLLVPALRPSLVQFAITLDGTQPVRVAAAPELECGYNTVLDVSACVADAISTTIVLRIST